MKRSGLPTPPTATAVLGDHESRIRRLEFRPGAGSFRIRGPFTITKDDDLATGVDLFVPGVGSILYDALIVINTGFDDSGVGGDTDLQFFLGGTAWSLFANDVGFGIKTADDFSGGLAVDTGSNLGQQLLQRAANLAGYGRISAPVLTADPLVAKVALFAGDGSTGDADIYVLTGTPS